MEAVTLEVKGMSCGHCKAAVEKAVGALAGVQSVEVDLENGKVATRFDDSEVTIEEIKKAIDEEGYEVV